MSETLHHAAEFTTGIGPAHAASFLFLIPLLPLLGAAINGLLGYFLQKRFGKKAISFVAVGVMVAASLVAIAGFTQLLRLPAGERTLIGRSVGHRGAHVKGQQMLLAGVTVAG